MKGQLLLHGHVFAELMQTSRDMRMPNIMEHDACLYYILNGRGEIYSPSEKVVMQSNESVLMKCGNYIGCFVDATPDNPHRSIGFHFHPDVVQRMIQSGRIAFDRSNHPVSVSAVRISSNDQLQNFVEGISYYLEHPEQASEAFVELKMQELLVILAQSGNASDQVLSVLRRLYKKEEIVFHQVIEANLYNNLSIPELSVLTHRSESTFKRDFKKFYQESPAKYFRKKRLSKAADLLLTSSLNINEIAWDCGFENPAHFSKTFFDQYQQWPRDYRLNQANATQAV